MADLAVGPTHAHALRRSEHLRVEIDGLGGTVDDEVRADLGVAVGNRLHGRAHARVSFMHSGSCGFTRENVCSEPNDGHIVPQGETGTAGRLTRSDWRVARPRARAVFRSGAAPPP